MTKAPPTGYPVFNTPPALAAGIAKAGFRACDTASNHSLDQGQHGIAHTGRALIGAGVRHTGSFRSAKARRTPLLLRAAGVRLGFLAFTTDTNGLPLPHPWSVNIARLHRIRRDVRRDLRAGADGVSSTSTGVPPGLRSTCPTRVRRSVSWRAGSRGPAA